MQTQAKRPYRKAAIQSGSIVEHARYGKGLVLREWGAWRSAEPDERPLDINGAGIFEVRFRHGIESINTAWLKLC